MKKLKTEWDLGLIYKKGDNDPKMEQDIRALERAVTAFEKKYRGKDFLSTPNKLRKALDEATKINDLHGGRPYRYFSLKSSLNTADTAVGARVAQYEERLIKIMNQMTFFHLEVAKVPANRHQSFLKAKVLSPYAYQLEKIFKNAKYNLSEKEEQMIDLLSQPSYTMWVDGSEKLLNEQTVEHKGKSLPISEVVASLFDMPKKDRREVYAKMMKILKSISHFAEAEMNAIYTYKKISDDRRGYKQPYSSTVVNYEQTEEEVESLVDVVTKHFSISQKFYKLHARLLKERKITMADRGVKIGKINKKFKFDESIKIISEEFEKIDPKYRKMLESFIKNGQFDVYPRKGKSAGAFCAGGENDEATFILLNHTGDINSVETIAHEMGHAIHTELSKSQPSYYQRYSMAVAETASTFFEQVVSAALEKHLSKKEKIILLHNKIMGDISTIFRQIALFNFENELHQKLRKEGLVSKESMARLLSKHMRSYLGPSVEVSDEDGYFFVYWSHIRRFFYVYSYAYGQLISRALYEKWLGDNKFAKKIEQFLSAGRSMSPYQIFKSIGIDTRDPKFFLDGLKGIERDIEMLERLTKPSAGSK